ncbi:trypsin-like peptidase domain-containing protein [Nocardioides sp. SOB44]|uniref:Trypsin-like peptidase domain-containing protein n=1 Tax=Nocardioides cremeus TaxID=3058044 RepID=A0ABT8TVN7_9ACTN|nr:trypsin-like peptidase domain-containing protein [Nocardioides cremeus]MDO3397379.1 trypsin-like peptidase domain-containing protein [Nocardioides cremeus]
MTQTPRDPRDQQPGPETSPYDETRSYDLGPQPAWTPGDETAAQAPVPPAPAAAPTAPPARGRKGFAAAVVAASLVVGGAAGFGGAAAWSALDDDPASSGNDPAVTTSQVVDTPEGELEPGSVQDVAETVLPSVVRIDVRSGQGGGSGSGIVLSSDGQILTNEHVIAAAGEGADITVSFDDGSRASATVLGSDPLTDTAVIQAEGVEGLTPATIGKSEDLRVGQAVVAIGSPFGLDATVTSGIVSALDRPVGVASDASGDATIYPAIQTDAAINPGNSGGPLVDTFGNVVGINSSIRTSGSTSGAGGSIGLGFSIPIDEVLPIVEQMAAGEEPTHARLGISVSDAGITEGQSGADAVIGALVREVGEDSTAGAAGLETGDVVVRVDDTMITGSDSLVATIRSYRPGDTVTLTFVRDGEERSVELELDTDATS